MFDDYSDVLIVVDFESLLGCTLIAAKGVEPEFNVVCFIEGVWVVYEMIFMVFETGDKDTLCSLLAPDVMESFEVVIDLCCEQGLSVDARFIGLCSSKIVDARLDEATNVM